VDNRLFCAWIRRFSWGNPVENAAPFSTCGRQFSTCGFVDIVRGHPYPESLPILSQVSRGLSCHSPQDLRRLSTALSTTHAQSAPEPPSGGRLAVLLRPPLRPLYIQRWMRSCIKTGMRHCQESRRWPSAYPQRVAVIHKNRQVIHNLMFTSLPAHDARCFAALKARTG
jgi:hypothetical protein